MTSYVPLTLEKFATQIEIALYKTESKHTPVSLIDQTLWDEHGAKALPKDKV